MPDRLPDNMPDKISECMSDRMPYNVSECIGDKMSWNVRIYVKIFATVGITRCEVLSLQLFVFSPLVIFNYIYMKERL